MTVASLLAVELGGFPGSGIVKDMVSNAFDEMAKNTFEFAAKANKQVLTFWINGTTKPVDGQCEAGGASANCAADWLQNGTRWMAVLACIVTLIICGTKMAMTRDSGVAVGVGKQLVTVAIVSGAGLALIQAAVVASDEISLAIWSTVPDMSATAITEKLGPELAVSGIGGWIFILAIMATLVGFAQLCLLIARSGLIVIMAGLLPIAAATSGTTTGEQWFKRMLAWLIALIIYKPVAVIIYTMSFVLASEGSDLIGVMSGFMLFILAIVAMPATMRLLVPQTSPATGKGGTLVAGAGAVASGAMMVGSGGASAAGKAGAGAKVAGGSR